MKKIGSRTPMAPRLAFFANLNSMPLLYKLALKVPLLKIYLLIDTKLLEVLGSKVDLGFHI